MDHLERLQGELQELLAPLVTHREEIDREIASHEATLSELRKVRRQLVSTITHLDPQPKQASSNHKPLGIGIAPERIDAFRDWLQAHKQEINSSQGVWATGLAEDPEFTLIPHQTGISKALKVLHDRGVLHLDRMQGLGGRKYYKVA